MAATRVSDIVVPEVFSPYVQQMTEEKSRLIQSGAMVRNPLLDGFLSGGGGSTFQIPGFRDLAQTAENISTDDPAVFSVPDNIGTDTEVGVRLSRNASWSSMDLAAALAGADPMDAISSRVSTYWALRLQKMIIAMVNGISKDNGVNDGGDYAHDIAGASFSAGVTDFSAEAQIDAAQTMGDSSDDLAITMVHSVVYAKMKKNNLIDFLPDSEGRVDIPTYLGSIVIVDDGMPSGTGTVRDTGLAGNAGTYESWFFGPGTIQLGVGSPLVPTEIDRIAGAGTGSGQEVLWNRVEWLPHMTGHAYTGVAANGGPSNAATANNLNDAGSWDRVYQERKMIKFARLITREA